MAWTEITDRDICIQGSENKINCIASGAVYAGQAVTGINGGSTDKLYVVVGNTGAHKRAIGVAAMDASAGESVAVYIAGAVCWGRANAAVVEGDWLYAAADGDWDDCTDAAGAEIVMSGAAIALITQGSSDGLVKVLLK